MIDVRNLIASLQKILQDHGNLPIYAEAPHLGWMSRDITVFVDRLAHWEADLPDAPKTGVACVKIGMDDR